MARLRIIAGTRRGLRLASVGKGDAGAHLRPTSDRVREALFSMLLGGRFDVEIEGANVLDLFAGTGALGLEALSRGAGAVTFVEQGRVALGLLAKNIALARAEDQTRVLRTDATRLPANTGAAATLVFLDPPYGKGLAPKALAAARAGGWIAPGALIVVEENAPIPSREGFAPLDTRRWGDTHITFLRAL